MEKVHNIAYFNILQSKKKFGLPCPVPPTTHIQSLVLLANTRGWIGWLVTPLFGTFKLEIKKGNKTITEAILFQIPVSFCQVSPAPPPSKNPGRATEYLA